MTHAPFVTDRLPAYPVFQLGILLRVLRPALTVLRPAPTVLHPARFTQRPAWINFFFFLHNIAVFVFSDSWWTVQWLQICAHVFIDCPPPPMLRNTYNFPSFLDKMAALQEVIGHLADLYACLLLAATWITLRHGTPPSSLLWTENGADYWINMCVTTRVEKLNNAISFVSSMLSMWPWGLCYNSCCHVTIAT